MEVGEDIDAPHTNLEYLKAYLFAPKGRVKRRYSKLCFIRVLN